MALGYMSMSNNVEIMRYVTICDSYLQFMIGEGTIILMSNSVKHTSTFINTERGATELGKRITVKNDYEQSNESFMCQLDVANHDRDLAEKAYRAIFESTGTAMVVINEGTVILRANLEFEYLSGYTRETIEGRMCLKDIIHPEYIEKSMRYHRLRMLSESSVPRQYDSKLITNNDCVKNVLITNVLIPGTKHTIISFLDSTPLNQAEEEASSLEQKLNAIVQNAPIGIIIIRDERMLLANRVYIKMFGYQSPTEVMGKSILEHIAPWNRKQMSQMLEDQIRSISAQKRYEMFGLKKDGSQFPLCIDSMRFDLSDGPAAICFVTDISEFRQVENALLLSEEKFSKAFNTCPSPMSITVFPGGCYVDINDAYVQFSGYSREEIIGHTVRDVGILEWMEDPAVHAIEERKPFLNMEAHARTKSGDLRMGLLSADFIEVAGDIFYVSVFFDITERIRTEQDLSLKAILLDSANDSIVLHDFDGRIQYVNDTTCRYYGFTKDEMMQKNIFKLNAIEPAKVQKKRLKELVAKGRCVFEAINLRKDGAQFPVEINAKVIETGDKQYVLNVSRDITRRKRNQEKLEKYNKHLEELVAHRTAKLQDINTLLNEEHIQRWKYDEQITILNESLERRSGELIAINKNLESFTYAVSHNLRAPLMLIEGYCQMLIVDHVTEFSDEVKEIVQIINKNCKRMGGMISDLYETAYLSNRELHLEDVNLSEIAEDVAETLQKSYPERNVRFAIEPYIQVHGDKALLRSALENLFNNAWKFTGKHSSGDIELGTLDYGGKKTYFVRDNGAGFDMNYASKLFCPFQRFHSEKEFPGAGIGLAIVRCIVERHGGKIWAESAVEQGATFYFNLGW